MNVKSYCPRQIYCGVAFLRRFCSLLAVLPVLFFHEITNLYSNVSVCMYVARYFVTPLASDSLLLDLSLRLDVCAFVTLEPHLPHLKPLTMLCKYLRIHYNI